MKDQEGFNLQPIFFIISELLANAITFFKIYFKHFPNPLCLCFLKKHLKVFSLKKLYFNNILQLLFLFQ